ncbi:MULTISPECIES: Crp/Fnr family transcriptional regulator [Listeria]|uniref:Crp/Fnr family transcriptional regulator n=1 Tax=Listeria TaxID=1637 RepID=UPI001FC9A362|nr:MULTISPECIES: Crp/Fnr family transcriptional regulator [Listeria]
MFAAYIDFFYIKKEDGKKGKSQKNTPKEGTGHMSSEIKEFYSNETVELEFSHENLIELLIHSPRVSCEYRKLRKRNIVNPIANNEVYFLSSGIMVLTKTDFPINIRKASEFVGLERIILQEDGISEYRAIVDCEVIVFQVGEVLMELFSHQEGWLFLAVEMQKQIKFLTNRYLLMQEDSFSRLKATFFDLASRFGTKQDETYILPKQFNKKFIAEYAGLSPSSVKNVEVSLKSEGFIEIADKFYIVNLEKYCSKNVFS